MTTRYAVPTARHSLAWFAVVSTLSILGYARVHPSRDVLASDHKLSMIEAGWRDAAEIVVTGDSRSQAAFVPELLSSSLGARVLNFARSSQRYSEPYYRAIDRVIDEHEGLPTLLMGVSAFSLTKTATSYSPHDENFEMFDRAITMHLDGLISALTPLTKWDVMKFLRPGQHVIRRVTYHHADGWVIIDRIPRDPSVELEIYRNYFARSRVDEELVSELLARVAVWSRAGLLVVGARAPASLALLELEDRDGGFDETSFVQRWERAGGRWLQVPRRQRDTQDGCHLTADASLAYTAEVAPLLRRARDESLPH